MLRAMRALEPRFPALLVFGLALIPGCQGEGPAETEQTLGSGA